MGFHLVVINSPNGLAAFKERSMRRRREGRRVFFLPRRDMQKPGAGSPPPGLMRTWMRCRRLTGGAKKVPAAK